MILSDISVRRPVFATVLSLLLVAFGVLSFIGLPLRELPNIDPPVVSITTTYPGASADVVQSRITEILEDQVSGIEGIDTITSRSRDGVSEITIEFTLARDIEAAANDVRDSVARVSDRLPDGARAFFRPGNPSVIMLDPTQRDPRQTFAEDGRRDFRLSAAAFEAMAAHIEASLDLSSGGPRIAAARASDDALFFASREHFSIGHLCNHWTAGVLNAAGMPVRPVAAITSGEVVATIDRAQTQ